jgi:hypothetical protein
MHSRNAARYTGQQRGPGVMTRLMEKLLGGATRAALTRRTLGGQIIE